MIFIITGPSGAGKTSLVRRVLSDLKNIKFSVSHTTRPKRDSEVEEEDYYFITMKEFKKMIKADKFAEWASVHGSYYGTSKREIEEKSAQGDLLLDIDVQGAQQIKELYPKAVFIFIMPPLLQELKRRLEARGDESALSIIKRLEMAHKEISSYHHFDFIVINNDLERAVLELESIIRSSKCRVEFLKQEIISILQSFNDN